MPIGIKGAGMSKQQTTVTRIPTPLLNRLRELSDKTGLPIIWLVQTAVEPALDRWEKYGIEVTMKGQDE
jgi:predicted DNA-binding protein